MDKEQLIKMDAYMLLSILNMKLRDEFDSLENFCVNYDIDEIEINNKLKIIGYRYYENTNQFIAFNEKEI